MYTHYLVALLAVLLPASASAQTTLTFKLNNPLLATSFTDLVLAVLRIFITVASPIVVMFIIFAGFKYVTARGDANQVGEATRALTYAIIGGLLILGAVAIAGIISTTIGSFGSPTGG